MNVYEGVHAVKRAAYLVSELGVYNVKSEVSLSWDHSHVSVSVSWYCKVLVMKILTSWRLPTA